MTATRRKKQGAPKDGASPRLLGYVRVSTEERGTRWAGLAALTLQDGVSAQG